jgi:uncharacterized protein (TIGR04255 family)
MKKNYIIDFKFLFKVKFKNLEMFIAELSKHFDISNIKETPIVQIPKHIRNIDEKLRFVPIYEIELKDKNFIIGLAEYAIVVKFKKSYTSWSEFFKPFLKELEVIFKFSSVEKFETISLQYIDFFENNIFEEGKIKCSNINVNEKVFLKSSFNKEKIQIIKILTNEAKFKDKDGSVVDITTIANFEEGKFEQIIDILHDENVEEFKKVVSDEIIRELGL